MKEKENRAKSEIMARIERNFKESAEANPEYESADAQGQGEQAAQEQIQRLLDRIRKH